MTHLLDRLTENWKELLLDQFSMPYFLKLASFLQEERANFLCYPEEHLVFRAFELTLFEEVKVVILGQDPYHGTQQANGLCFSVNQGMKAPPSLKNIFKELQNDLHIPIAEHGELKSWATQGVLLLNSVLTVRAHEAGSHQGKGWEVLTNHIISLLSEKKENLVFILWGAYAMDKARWIDPKKHLILCAPHPSPLSAYKGFFGCQHFSKTNEFIEKKGSSPIDWELPAYQRSLILS